MLLLHMFPCTHACHTDTDSQPPDEMIDDYDELQELTRGDVWPVITAYFDEKGLVRQQLDR